MEDRKKPVMYNILSFYQSLLNNIVTAGVHACGSLLYEAAGDPLYRIPGALNQSQVTTTLQFFFTLIV